MADRPVTPSVWLLSADIMSQLGGGFRQQRWCEYILAREQSIRLFHVAGPFAVRWTDVHTVEELRDRRKQWIAAAPPRAGVRDSRTARAGRLLKHIFMLDLFFPSIFRLIAIMNRMLRTAPPKVALLCSSPPFAMGVAGWIMKALHGDRIVMALDMRDLWSLHTAFPGPKVQKRLVERWVIGGADIFTTVAPALASRFAARFGRTPEVVYNVATQAVAVPAGRPPFSWQAHAPEGDADSVKIVYTGSIPEGFYDIDGFLEAVALFHAEHPQAAIQFVFVGAGGEVAARLARYAIPPRMIVFIAQVSHAEVARIQQAADVLLFIGYKADDNQGQVSIKLFEYFRRGKPILAVHIRKDSDVDFLIDLYCGKNVNLLDVRTLSAMLARLAERDFAVLPAAHEVDSKDGMLLSAYDKVVDEIVSRL